MIQAGDLPEVSIEDTYRAYMRAEFNTSGGKRGIWLRGRDSVKVPARYKKDLADRARIEEDTAKGILKLLAWLEEHIERVVALSGASKKVR